MNQQQHPFDLLQQQQQQAVLLNTLLGTENVRLNNECLRAQAYAAAMEEQRDEINTQWERRLQATNEHHARQVDALNQSIGKYTEALNVLVAEHAAFKTRETELQLEGEERRKTEEQQRKQKEEEDGRRKKEKQKEDDDKRRKTCKEKEEERRQEERIQREQTVSQTIGLEGQICDLKNQVASLEQQLISSHADAEKKAKVQARAYETKLRQKTERLEKTTQELAAAKAQKTLVSAPTPTPTPTPTSVNDASATIKTLKMLSLNLQTNQLAERIELEFAQQNAALVEAQRLFIVASHAWSELRFDYEEKIKALSGDANSKVVSIDEDEDENKHKEPEEKEKKKKKKKKNARSMTIADQFERERSFYASVLNAMSQTMCEIYGGLLSSSFMRHNVTVSTEIHKLVTSVIALNNESIARGKLSLTQTPASTTK